MDVSCRLYDFNVFNDEAKITDEGPQPKKFIIQMFGKDVQGKTYCIFVKNFKPFLYVKIPEDKHWNRYNMNVFVKALKSKCGSGIASAELIDRKKTLWI